MHPLQSEFCKRVLDAYPEFQSGVRVLDCGSLDINGNNRGYFKEPFTYVGIDVGPGRNVDVVCDAADYRDEPFDVVVSTEMLEHCKRWEEVVRNMVALTRPGGLLLMTWASPGRGEHGTFRCSPGDSPHTNGHYRGISAVEFAEVARPANWAETFILEDRADAGDVYFYGRKK